MMKSLTTSTGITSVIYSRFPLEYLVKPNPTNMNKADPADKTSTHPGTGSLREAPIIEGLIIVTGIFPFLFYNIRSHRDFV